MPDTTDRLDTTIDALADTIRSIRDEASSLTELLGRLVEGVHSLRLRLAALTAENNDLRGALGALAPDTTTKED